MELIHEIKRKVASCLENLDNYIEQHKDEFGFNETFLQTQSLVSAAVLDKDKNFRKILEQQIQLKYIIEIDQRIESLKRSNREDRLAIDRLRRDCAKLSIDAIKEKTQLQEVHQKEMEQYRMEQMRSIVEDYNRHEKLVEVRKREVVNLKKNIENEAINRPSLMKSVEDEMERKLRNRKEINDGSNFLPMPLPEDPETLELTTIDEYDLYSKKKTTPSQAGRKRANSAGCSGLAKRGGSSGRGRGGGGKKRGGAAGISD